MSITLDYYTVVDYAAENAEGRNGLSSRPEYYSGRGVNRGDLNECHLQRIHTKLKAVHGDDVAANFVRMVKSLTDLSATNFLNQLQAFCWRGGEWGEAAVGEETCIDVGPDNGSRKAVAFGTIVSMFGRNVSPELTQMQTEDMQNAFLRLTGAPVERRQGRISYVADGLGCVEGSWGAEYE